MPARVTSPTNPSTSEALAARFREDGAVVVPGVFDPGEIAALRAQVIALEERVVADRLGLPDNNWRGEVLWAMYGLIDHLGDDYLALLGHPGLLALAQAILGPRFSWMARSGVTIKRDGEGVGIGWHRDWQDVPAGMNAQRFHAQAHLIACTVPLDPYTADSCFWYFPGSHRIPLDEAQALAKGKRQPFSSEGAEPLLAEPGDLIIHDYWVLHGSPPVGPGAPGRRGLVLAFWSHELASYTQQAFPQVDLRHEQRERILATGVAVRQRSPWNQGAAPFALAEIAKRLGYSDRFAFSKAFARVAGSSPGRYRQRIAHFQRNADERSRA